MLKRRKSNRIEVVKERMCVSIGESLVHEGKRNSTEYSHADLSLGTNLNSAIGSTSSSLSSSSSSGTDSFDSSRVGIKITV